MNNMNNINYINNFYKKYPYFDILFYKKINNGINNENNCLEFKENLCTHNDILESRVIHKINNLSNIQILMYYDNCKNKNNHISSLNDFYNIYNDFDIDWYKRFNLDINDKNYYDILVHMHKFGYNENRIYSLKSFEKKFGINLYFIKYFYNDFYNKSYIDIAEILFENNNFKKYILSNEKYDDIFNNIIYKNENIQYNIDIESILNQTFKKFIENNKNDNNKYLEVLYKSYLYHNYYIKNIDNLTNIIINYNSSNSGMACHYEEPVESGSSNNHIIPISHVNDSINNYLPKINEKNNNIFLIGHAIVNNINEVLHDLSNKNLGKNLEKGISLIIRAKNEELNIKN